MPWLIVMVVAVVVVFLLDVIFNYGDNVGEATGATFLIVAMVAVIVGLGVGTSYSMDKEHYHFIETSYSLVECEGNIFTLTKNGAGEAVYNYIYNDGTGKKVSRNISASSNIVFEYSDTATPMIYIYDAVYNSKAATAWFVDPTVQNIKIITPKDSIINTLY